MAPLKVYVPIQHETRFGTNGAEDNWTLVMDTLYASLDDAKAWLNETKDFHRSEAFMEGVRDVCFEYWGNGEIYEIKYISKGSDCECKLEYYYETRELAG